MSLSTAAKAPRSEVSPLWSKEALREALRSKSATLTQICRNYSQNPARWRRAYGDTVRWRAEDPELDEMVKQNTLATDSKKRKSISGGRPKKDEAPEVQDWKIRYCESLLSCRGSRIKAALVTPYSPDQIYKMLNERYTEYDREFSEMVHLTEMQLVAFAEEVIWQALDDAKFPKERAWIAKEILKVRDRQRWGDKLDVTMSGTVNHKHSIDRQALLLEASKDISLLLANPETKAIESGPVIEAEVVDVV